MAKGTFGERLKREREMRGVSLDEIASATRIGTRFLEALENEQWDRLPGGVFNRGFIRAVARFLGLDEESLIAEYATTTNDRPEVAVWAKGAGKPRRSIWPWVAGLVIVALAAGGWLGYQHYGPQVQAWRERLHPAPASAAPAVPRPAPAVPAASTAAARVAGAAADEPATLELKVEAGKTTRVSIIADGKTVFDGTLNAGENQHFEAKDRFVVSARDPSAVLLELNGQTVPPLGPPEQPGTVTLTRKDLKKPQGGQD
jgi:cytoskeleton protein RodZ